MISAALMLIMASAPTDVTPTFSDTPAFAFACRPKEQGAAGPTYEYRVFVPARHGGSGGPAKVVLSKMEGVRKDVSALTLDRGLLFVLRGPRSAEDSPPMFKVNALSGSLTDVLYDFQMMFLMSGPSEGRLRITQSGEEQTFPAECDQIDGSQS